VTRLEPLLKRGWALLLLPLSVVPFLLLGPQIAESHRNFSRSQESAALAAPVVVPSAAELARWQPLPPYSGAIPVVTYHRVGSVADRGYTVSPARLARHMEMLSRAGFHTISIHQYSRWRRGLPAGLPSRPILITFDDGRLDSFRGADRVLQRYGFKATMFARTGEIERRNPSYLQWGEMHAMEKSGRWDIQPATADGHAQVTVDAAGHPGEFYAYRRFTRSTGQETYADWQQRVSRDVFDAREAMVAQGFEPVSIAVPGGNYGQRGTNDGRIPDYMRSLLGTQFGVVFVTDARNRPAYTTRSGEPSRYEARRDTTADDLYGWLRAEDPAARAKGRR
jgi:hypothetical protein